MRPLFLLLLLSLPATAQEVDCADAMDQASLNQCAYADWEAADAELNRAYGKAMALLAEWDEMMEPELQGGPQALKEAQRAWITFRDRGCEAEGFAMRGGSAEPLLVYGCMARVTEERTRQLTDMVEAYEDQ